MCYSLVLGRAPGRLVVAEVELLCQCTLVLALWTVGQHTCVVGR